MSARCECIHSDGGVLCNAKWTKTEEAPYSCGATRRSAPRASIPLRVIFQAHHRGPHCVDAVDGVIRMPVVEWSSFKRESIFIVLESTTTKKTKVTRPSDRDTTIVLTTRIDPNVLLV
jgi:hypothetical protein